MHKIAASMVRGIAVLTLYSGCVVTRGINPQAFDTPPYSTVVEGLQPKLKNIPLYIPPLEPGAKVAFFVTGTGTVHMVTMDELVVLDVKGAAAGKTIDLTEQIHDVIVPKEVVALGAMHIDEDVKVSKAMLAMETSDRHTSVTTERASADILSRNHDIAVVATEASSDMQVSSDSSLVRITEGDAREMEVETADARFGFLDDALSMRVESDFDIIKVLREQFIVDGFYQNDVILDGDRSYAISLKEEQAFLNLLRNRAALSELLNRPDSRRYREKAQAGAVKVVLGARFVAGEVKHHGQQVLLTLQVSNGGEVPAYDLLMLNPIPAHTTFERFPITSTRESGFLRSFNQDAGMIICRLYRPLLPGQTFKMSVLLRLDRWDITAQHVRP